VLASDFVSCSWCCDTIIVAFLALKQPAIGGLANSSQVAREHFNWSLTARWPILSGWILVMIIFRSL